MAAKRERLQPPISVSGKKPEELKAEVVAQLAKIPAVLEGKVPADQAEGYKSWLVAISGKVANAATEGGFFGFGGESQRGRNRSDQRTCFLAGRESLVSRSSNPLPQIAEEVVAKCHRQLMRAKAAFLLLVDDGRNGLLGNPGGTGHTVHGELPRFCNSRAGPVKRVSYSRTSS